MSVHKSSILVIALFYKALTGQILTDTVAFDYLKTVQLAPRWCTDGLPRI